MQSLTSSYYVRAFNCQGGSTLTSSSRSETSGYNWIVSKGTKGYIQSGGSGGNTLGVVLNNTIIDFSHSYLAKRGSANNASQVRGIQSTLSCLGYSVGSVDGIFGAQTEAAVKEFQQSRGLTADGIVGKQTYHHLSHATY
ncbi:peptidoglycan-binding protein [Bacillus sp. IB182487]|uniref:Peptidoglycan-binding protein n=2 Tax=Metabacillus arenae TaxID=2771434 RepID=A0A926NAR3_9BACI|nr:peptidoglycan-binding protein [Metabacillus arenae]